MNSFVWPVRTYWEDTDAGGVVYYANYLKFMERARTEWLRAAGIEQGPLQERLGLVLVVVDAQTQFRKPARYGDLLAVTCNVAEYSRASLSFRQDIYRESVAGELLVTGAIRAACVDLKTFKPRPLPEILLTEMKK